MTVPSAVGPTLRRRVIGTWATAVVLAAALIPGWPISLPRHAAAAEPASYATTSTFELVPGSGLVHVTVVLTIHNNRPSSSTSRTCYGVHYDPSVGTYVPYTFECGTTTIYYINSSALVVDAEGTNFRAATPGGAAGVTVKPEPEGFPTATVTFPRIQYGQTRTITVTYDVPGGAPRTDTYTRVGVAYARFCGFLAGAYLGNSDSMRMIVPSTFDITQYFGDDVPQTRDGDTTVLTVPARVRVKDSSLSETCVEAVDKESYVSDDFTSDSGVELTVKAWPEDLEWLDTISAAAGGALDDLEAVIGMPPPGDTVSVEEVVSEALGGYAGLADTRSGIVRISETAMEPIVAVHEMAHLWFNYRLASESWLVEGYAEFLAQALVPGAPGCPKPSPSQLAALDLSTWKFLPKSATGEDQSAVRDQYDAACWLIAEVTDKMPRGATQMIYAYALGSKMPYAGDGDGEALSPRRLSWAGFLDLVDERGIGWGNGDPEWLGELLLSVGIGAGQSWLDDRLAARTKYHHLEDESGSWDAPYLVRQLMSEWRYDKTDAAIAAAIEVVTLHQDAVAKVPELEDADTVRIKFENATKDALLADAGDLAQTELKAASVVAEGVTAAEEGKNPLDMIGLIGSDLGKDANTAVEALVAGHFADATKDGRAVLATRNGATLAGGLRLGGSGIVILGGAGAFVMYRRRRARRAAASGPQASPVGEDVELPPTY